MTPDALRGRRILIVEDEILLAIDLQNLLEEKGLEVVGIVPSVQKALQAVADLRPDVATLDLNLRGQSSQPVADALHQSGIPFVVTSGYTTMMCDFSYQNVPFVKKPIDENELMEALRSMLA
ncbi:hypothetical protein TQ29_02225 [Actibacterium sp. EMB200-NS6]|nr:hypothetical protein TQ29_02225 [Actibacterium sp. EMB200-NS6]